MCTQQTAKLRELERRLKSFREIALKIASSGNLVELFGVIIANLGSIVPFDHVSMVLVDADANLYYVPVAADFDTAQIKVLKGKTIQPSHTLLSRVLPEGVTVYRPHISRSAPLFPCCRKLLEKGIRSDLLIPLRVEGRCIGTLNIASRTIDPFDSDDISISEDIALQVAVAVNKCQLFDDLSTAKEEVEHYNRMLEERVESKAAELKATQEKLLENERLASIGHLGASLGHELRNPLGVIKNVSYYLSRKLTHGNEKIQRQIAILDREITTAERIINNLLNFSRNRAPEFSRQDIPAVFHQSMKYLKIPASIRVEIDLNSQLPAVYVDRGELEQVFQNLLQNSIDAMPGGGEILVSAHAVAETGEIEITISDRGCGIPPENLERIFEPLFTMRKGGIGLGLPLVRSIVKRHKGRIEVRSTVGRGTTFFIGLPLDRHESERGTRERASR